jgi:hypothetical protein
LRGIFFRKSIKNCRVMALRRETMSRQEDIEQLISMHTSRYHELELQDAFYGPRGDPSVRMEMRMIAEKITALQAELGKETTAATPTAGTASITNVLFLASEPIDTVRLRIGEEIREIHEQLQRSQYRDRFHLDERMAVRPVDFVQALLDLRPNIVHFSGHGAATGELCFEGPTGTALPVEPDALAALFEQFADQVKCVLLNACYAKVQAKAIVKHIDYVIGMNKAIKDKAAIAFSVGFYQALGGGRTIEDAFKLGRVQIQLQGIPDHLTPVLLKKG